MCAPQAVDGALMLALIGCCATLSLLVVLRLLTRRCGEVGTLHTRKDKGGVALHHTAVENGVRRFGAACAAPRCGGGLVVARFTSDGHGDVPLHCTAVKSVVRGEHYLRFVACDWWFVVAGGYVAHRTAEQCRLGRSLRRRRPQVAGLHLSVPLLRLSAKAFVVMFSSVVFLGPHCPTMDYTPFVVRRLQWVDGWSVFDRPSPCLY